MLFLVVFVYPHNLSLPLLFLACFVTAAIIEYYTSLIFDQVFDVLLWNYRGYHYNINGRIIVPRSIFWGALSTLALTFAHPEIESYRLPVWAPYFIFTAIVAMLADFMSAMDTLMRLKRRLAEMTDLRKKFRDYLMSSNVCETPQELLALNIHADHCISAVHKKGIFTESYSDISPGQLAAELALIKTRHENLSRPAFAERRLLRAFPLLRVHDEATSMEKLQPTKANWPV